MSTGSRAPRTAVVVGDPKPASRTPAWSAPWLERARPVLTRLLAPLEEGVLA